MVGALGEKGGFSQATTWFWDVPARGARRRVQAAADGVHPVARGFGAGVGESGRPWRPVFDGCSAHGLSFFDLSSQLWSTELTTMTTMVHGPRPALHISEPLVLTESRSLQGCDRHCGLADCRLIDSYTLGLQPYSQKVVRPPKPTPTIF